MTTTRVPGSFELVYLVANTIMNVTQEEQLAVFANAAAHLEPGECFVVEVIVPQLRRVLNADVVEHAPVPRWGWGVAPPYQG